MKGMDILFRLLLATACALSFSGMAQAGGSVGFREDAVPLLQREPALLKMVESALEVGPTGWGVRLGPHFGDEAGKRITPFRFEARPKGASGPYTLLLTIYSPEGASNGEVEATTVWIDIKPLHPPTAKTP